MLILFDNIFFEECNEVNIYRMNKIMKHHKMTYILLSFMTPEGFLKLVFAPACVMRPDLFGDRSEILCLIYHYGKLM